MHKTGMRICRSIRRIPKKSVEVIGISRDGIASHVKFAEKYNLLFILLSDPDLEAIGAYGVWQEKKLYGKVSFGVTLPNNGITRADWVRLPA